MRHDCGLLRILAADCGNRADHASMRGRSPFPPPVRAARWLANCVLAIALWSVGGLSAAQEPASAGGHIAPPLPAPTEAQLERGRELLGKIVHVIHNIPLQDSSAVLGVFGFKEFDTFVHPTHTRVTPKLTTTRAAIPVELLGTGFQSFSNIPLNRSPKSYSLASVGGVLNRAEACIAIDDVRLRFANVATTRSGPVRIIDRFRWPPRKHNIGFLSFQPLDTPAGLIGTIRFEFDYQTCADSFTFSYLNDQSEEASK